MHIVICNVLFWLIMWGAFKLGSMSGANNWPAWIYLVYIAPAITIFYLYFTRKAMPEIEAVVRVKLRKIMQNDDN